MNYRSISTPDDIVCVRKYTKVNRNGSTTVYANYIDGMEVWMFWPGQWAGGKLIQRFIGEKEVF